MIKLPETMLIINNLVQIAIVTKVHGYQGEVKIKCKPEFVFTDHFPEIVFLLINNKPVPFFVEYFTILDSTSLIVKFESIKNKDEAIRITKLDLYAETNSLENDSDDFSQPSLLNGYQVFNQDEVFAGNITDFFPNATQFLLELDNNILVPLHEDLIIKIDKKKKIIWLQIAEGLI
jgi:16S rRNA processing protein RimM